MVRYVSEVSYDGAGFYGWQVQPKLPTVQGALEDALSLLNGKEVAVAGAGRTDVGVHARAQVCTYDMEKDWEPGRLTQAINANVPKGVSVMRTAHTNGDFHARFNAAAREYVYFIWNSRTLYPMIEPYTFWVKDLNRDWDAAASACKIFEGTHDFGAFCRAEDRPDDSERTIYRAELFKRGNLLWFRVKGKGFLTNMVRIMAGALDKVSREPGYARTLTELLKPGAERRREIRTLPANALFLWKITYDPSPWKQGKNSI